MARIHPATLEYVFFHLSAILAARICMKHSASLPKTPSSDTTSGVNDARHASAASLYILFLFSTADLYLIVINNFIIIQHRHEYSRTCTELSKHWPSLMQCSV